jgi:hypothetical protein
MTDVEKINEHFGTHYGEGYIEDILESILNWFEDTGKDKWPAGTKAQTLPEIRNYFSGEFNLVEDICYEPIRKIHKML